MIVEIADEFRAAGWTVFRGDEPDVYIAKPNFYLSKQYFLMPCDNDWVLSLPTHFRDPEYNEALCILNRARLKMASDRTFSRNAIASQQGNSFLYHYKGNMTQFIRINATRFINFSDIRDICIDSEDDEELSVTITWAGVEDAIDTFSGDEAKKIIGAAELFSINTLNQLNIMNPPEEPI